MNLEISERIIQEISEFSRNYGTGKAVFKEPEIFVPVQAVSIKFFQPERYSRSIACFFAFEEDVGFFFEDIFLAIEAEKSAYQGTADGSSVDVNTLERNDSYVHHVLEFCEKHIALLTSVPPPWFRDAVRISDAATRRHSPDLADEDLLQKQALWRSWQG